MRTPETEQLWFKALFEEDCLRVRKLLQENPELLKVGWKSDNDLRVIGSPDNHWKPVKESLWTGRTALHVGARRGDIELVKDVLKLCYLKAFIDVPPRADEAGPQATGPIDSTENIVASSGPSALGKSEGAENKEEIRGLEGDKQTNGESDKALQNYKASIANISSILSLVRRRNNREEIVGLSNNVVSKVELRELLLCKDGWYELEALAMATLQGNLNIIVLLVYAFGECYEPPYLISRCEDFSPQALIGKDSAHRTELSKVTKEVINYFRTEEPIFMLACEEEYSRHRDFNFLPLEEYLFHFSWTSRFEEVFHVEHKRQFREKYWTTVRQWPDLEETRRRTTPNNWRRPWEEKEKLWRFLLRLHDGQGRPPVDVAIDDHVSSVDFFPDGLDGADSVCVMTAPDGSGKMPVHRAAATRGGNVFREIISRFRDLDALKNCESNEHPIFKILRDIGMGVFDLGLLSRANGFRDGGHSSTALQAAIIHNNVAFGDAWLSSFSDFGWKKLYPMNISSDRLQLEVLVDLDHMELVCFVGADVEWVRLMIKDGYLENSRANQPSETWERSRWKYARDLRLPNYRVQAYKHWWPTLHLIATYGNYQSLKLFVDNYSCDPFVEDAEESIALHCVMKDAISLKPSEECRGHFLVKFETHLLDYISCQHLLVNDQRKVKKILDDTFLADRQGCVNLFLEAGCDIFKSNKDREVPYPQGRLSSCPKFLSWWYDKQAKEFGAIQRSLNNAANAISVTATLIATTSFMGPLQPPRGFTQDHQMEYENVWVATFIFCNTLSFYLAIVAIVLSLIPSLPMPQQAMFEELRRTRVMVTLAVGVLFPSIVSVLLAFASSSISVGTPKITSSRGRNLAIASLSIGGLVIVAAFFLFVIRLLGICFPRSSWIKYMYKLTSF